MVQTKRRELAKQTYKPLTDKMAVSIIQAPNETDAGLILPDNQAQKFVTIRASVIAVGPEVKTVKIGDVVLLPGGNYEAINHKNQMTFVIAECQIWGIEMTTLELREKGIEL